MIHNERLIIVLSEDNSIKSATVFPIQYLDDTKTQAANLPPRDLTSTELDELITMCDAPTIASRDAALKQLADLQLEYQTFQSDSRKTTEALQTQLYEALARIESMTTATQALKDLQAEQLAALRTEQAEAMRKLGVKCAEAETKLATERTVFETTLAELNAKIVALQESMPWNVRIIDASAFVARIPQSSLVDLFTSSDEQQQAIATMLQSYRENDWPILLDSPEMQQAVGYLVQSGAITEDFVKELCRDSIKAEAYRDGE